MLSAAEHQALVACYNQAADPETRTRFQMLLLGIEQGWTAHQIAPLLQRYLAGGLAAVPRRSAPGREPTLTPRAEAEVRRVIEDNPHQHGVESANWTTILFAAYLEKTLGFQVDPETVRRHLHQLGYVCKRPTWTVAHKAAERADWVGNVSG